MKPTLQIPNSRKPIPILNRRELTELQKSVIELMIEKLQGHYNMKAQIEQRLAEAQQQSAHVFKEVQKELGIPEAETENWKLNKERNAFVYEEKKEGTKKEG